MEERKKWLDAVESFRIDIDSIIKCPHCEKENLKLKDVAFNDHQINKKEVKDLLNVPFVVSLKLYCIEILLKIGI